MPSTVPPKTPSTKTRAKTAQRSAVGRQLDAEGEPGDEQQQRHLDHGGDGDEADLAEEVGDRRHRGGPQPLEGAVVALGRRPTSPSSGSS